MAITPSFDRSYAEQLSNFTPQSENERRIWDSLEQLAQSSSYNRPVATFSEDCMPGELVNIYESGGILTARKARADSPLYAYAFVSTTAAVLAGSTGEITVLGTNLFLSGLTPGATYYLSNTPGQVSLTPGTNNQIVGIAYSDSILFQNFSTAISGTPNSIQLAIRNNGVLISPTSSVLDFVRARVSNVGSAITIEPEWNELKLSSDAANANLVANTLQNTGLEFTALAGLLYEFRVVGFYDAATVDTGCRYVVTGPTLTSLALRSIYTGVVAESVSTYDTPAGANAANALTGNIVEMRGFITVSAGGQVRIRFASSVVSSAITLKRGSYIQWRVL